jgi:hypothetical protein
VRFAGVVGELFSEEPAILNLSLWSNNGRTPVAAARARARCPPHVRAYFAARAPRGRHCAPRPPPSQCAASPRWGSPWETFGGFGGRHAPWNAVLYRSPSPPALHQHHRA